MAVAVLCKGRAADPYSLARETADFYLPPRASNIAARVSPSGTPQSTSRTADGQPSVGAPREAPAFAALAGYYWREETDVPLNLVARDGALTTVGSRQPLTMTPHGESGFQVPGSIGTTECIAAEQMTRLHLSHREPPPHALAPQIRKRSAAPHPGPGVLRRRALPSVRPSPRRGGHRFHRQHAARMESALRAARGLTPRPECRRETMLPCLRAGLAWRTSATFHEPLRSLKKSRRIETRTNVKERRGWSGPLELVDRIEHLRGCP